MRSRRAPVLTGSCKDGNLLPTPDRQHGGQFPPILSLEQWKTLFRQLDADFYYVSKHAALWK